MNDVTYAADSVADGTRDLGNQALYYAQEWGPRLLAALAILLLGWLIARAVKWAVASLINKTPLARRANQPNMAERHPSTIGAQVGDAAFWVVLLVALFLAAQPLGLASSTGPIGDMLAGFGQAVPRFFGAGLILFFGYVIATVAKKAVEAVITASHVERLSARVGTTAPTDPTMLPRTIGGIVFALIIIPAAIAALDTLNIAAISEPATNMLRIVLNAIPQVIAAGIIIALAYIIGKFASQLLTQFLATTGFDRSIGSLGLFAPGSGVSTTTIDPATGREQVSVSPSGAAPVTPSKAVGTAVFIAILIFGLMEGFRQLNFAYGSRIMAEILALFGQVAFGAIIITAAVVIARFVAAAIETSGGQTARMTAQLTRVAIIVLGAAIGLRFMGLADDIITLAFGLTLGAIAVAAALAFGLGGRDAAAKLLTRMADQAASPSSTPTSMSMPTPMQSTTPTNPTVL